MSSSGHFRVPSEGQPHRGLLTDSGVSRLDQEHVLLVPTPTYGPGISGPTYTHRSSTAFSATCSCRASTRSQPSAS